MPSSSRISSANVIRLPTGRSRPYELTFWPSSVSSRTPSAASRCASPTRSCHGRDFSRPRTLGHDAVRADGVAPHRDLQPGLVRPLTAHRQVAGELVEGREVAARQRATGADVVAEPRDRARAEREVDERVLLEQLVLHRLRPAAADDDLLAGVALLHGARVHEVLQEPPVGLLADRAGVEDEHVGLGRARRLPQAGRLEQALDALRVVRVHLAAVRGDVIAPHGSKDRAVSDRRPVTETSEHDHEHRGGHVEGAVAQLRRDQPEHRRTDAEAEVEEARVRGQAGTALRRLDRVDDQHRERREQQRPADAEQDAAEADRPPGGSDGDQQLPGAAEGDGDHHRAPRPQPVGQSARDQPPDQRREREQRDRDGAAGLAEAAVDAEQDHEAVDRGDADAGHAAADARLDRAARQKLPPALVLRRRGRSRQPADDERAEHRRDRRQRPNGIEPTELVRDLPQRRADREAAPDAEAVQADRPAATLRRHDADHPHEPAGVHAGLGGPVQEPRGQQRQARSGQRVERARQRRRQ